VSVHRKAAEIKAGLTELSGVSCISLLLLLLYYCYCTLFKR